MNEKTEGIAAMLKIELGGADLQSVPQGVIWTQASAWDGGTSSSIAEAPAEHEPTEPCVYCGEQTLDYWTMFSEEGGWTIEGGGGFPLCESCAYFGSDDEALREIERTLEML